MEVNRVVAMPPQLIGLDEIREDEALVDVLEQLQRSVDSIDVRPCGERLVDVETGENIVDLPHPVGRVSRIADRCQVVRPSRLEREVMAVRGSLVRTG